MCTCKHCVSFGEGWGSGRVQSLQTSTTSPHLPKHRVLSADSTYPDGHTQEKLPTELMHCPPSHTCGMVEHSSTSGENWREDIS